MLIYNATIIIFDDENRILPDRAAHMKDHTIHEIGESHALRVRYPDDE